MTTQDAPRCAMCKHWKRGIYRHGECSALWGSGKISPNVVCDGSLDVDGFETEESFGCVLHEPRGE